MKEGVQHDPTAQLTWISVTGARGVHAQASVGRKSEIMIGNARGGRSALPPYLGGKRKLVPFIFRRLARVLDPGEWPQTRFLDPMCGGGAISLSAKWHGFETISSDISVRSRLVARALIANWNVRIVQSDISRLFRSVRPESTPQNVRSYFIETAADMVDAANGRSEPYLSLLLLTVTTSFLRMFPMSLSSASDARYAVAGNWDRISPRRLGHYLKARNGLSPSRLWKTAERINSGVFGGSGTAESGDAHDVLSRIDADIAYLDPPYPGTSGYRDNYRLLDELLGDTPPATKIPSVGSLLEAAADIPLAMISLGGPNTILNSLVAAVARQRDLPPSNVSSI